MNNLKIKNLFLKNNKIETDNFINKFDSIVFNYSKNKKNNFFNIFINKKDIIEEKINNFKKEILKNGFKNKLFITNKKITFEKNENLKHESSHIYGIDFLSRNRDIYNPLSNIKLFTDYEDLEINLIAINILKLDNDRNYYIEDELLLISDKELRKSIKIYNLNYDKSIEFLSLVIKYVLYQEFSKKPIIKRVKEDFYKNHNNSYGYVDISFNKILEFLKQIIDGVENQKKEIIDFLIFDEINNKIEKFNNINIFKYKKVKIKNELKIELLKEKYLDFVKSLIRQFEAMEYYFYDEESDIDLMQNEQDIYLIENFDENEYGSKEVFELFACIMPTQMAINQMIKEENSVLTFNISSLIMLDDSKFLTMNREKNQIMKKIIKKSKKYKLKLVVFDFKEEIKFYNKLKEDFIFFKMKTYSNFKLDV